MRPLGTGRVLLDFEGCDVWMLLITGTAIRGILREIDRDGWLNVQCEDSTSGAELIRTINSAHVIEVQKR